jgi:hypothetical protein
MKIKYEVSDKMQDLINNAVQSEAAKKGFGVTPTHKQFLNGVIYYWIRKNIPKILDDNSEIQEIKEHKSLKKILGSS